MTTSYHWSSLVATKEPFLDIREGQYIIKKAGSRMYRAYFNDQPTRFTGHDVETVMKLVVQSLRDLDSPKAHEEDLPRVHGQNGFSS
jgi:hypothetical protein